jgi:hypothetical protein
MCQLLFKCGRGHETSVLADDVMDNEGNPPAALQCKKCLKESGYFVWASYCGTVADNPADEA